MAFSDSLLHSSSLIPTVKQQEHTENSSLELIRETKKFLRLFKQQEKVYRPITDFAASLFEAIQKLSATLGYFRLPLRQFQAMLVKVIMQHKGLQNPDNSMALNARVLHLKHQLMEAVFNTVRMQLFFQHQLLLPLIISLKSLLAEDKLSIDVYELLMSNICSVEGQLDVLLANAKHSSSVGEQSPEWVSIEVSIYY